MLSLSDHLIREDLLCLVKTGLYYVCGINEFCSKVASLTRG